MRNSLVQPNPNIAPPLSVPVKVHEEKFPSVAYFNLPTQYIGDTQWHRWLRHCTTSQKVAASIPNGVNGIFH